MSEVTFPGSTAISVSGTEGRSQRAELRRAAEAFEALFVQQLVRQMRRSQLDEGLFGKGTGASTYDAMFDQHLGQRLARESPFGIAELLEARWAENLEPAEDAESAARETGRNPPADPLGSQVSRSGADD